ncbi:hypothetical protein [Melittangium boletus]|uniref:hypothetical protein n=1 Tax=Melittangium boletus TaxID=83453 RepID=UPI003DA4C47F
MNRKLLFPLCLLLSGCSLLQWYRRPEHAPAEEAARFQFPLELPADSRMKVPGVMATAIQLAMDDFRPPGAHPHSGATAEEQCLYRRESYDVFASPASQEVMLVRFVLSPEACDSKSPVLDMGATYAIDVQTWRILAIQP